MTLPKSYYSDVRNPSGMQIQLYRQETKLIEVNAEDIESVEIFKKNDIVAGSFPYFTVKIDLFDNDRLYYLSDYDNIHLQFTYNQSDGSLFVSEDNIFYKEAESEISQIAETIKTTLKLTNLLTLKEKQIDVIYGINTTNFDNVLNIVYMLGGMPCILPRDYIHWSWNSILGMKINRIYKELMFSNAFVPSEKNGILEYKKINYEQNADLQISFKELFEKPKLNTIPKIRNLSLLFTNIEITEGPILVFTTQTEFESLTDKKQYIIDKQYYIPDSMRTGISSTMDNIRLSGRSVYSYENANVSFDGNTLILSGIPKGTYQLEVDAYKAEIKNEGITKEINSSGEDLELKSNILSFDGKYYNYDNENFLIERISKPYQYTDTYNLTLRGRFDINVLDFVNVEIERNVYKKCIVIEHKLLYKGAYKSEMKVVVIGESVVTLLTPSKKLYPSVDLKPTNIL